MKLPRNCIKKAFFGTPIPFTGQLQYSDVANSEAAVECCKLLNDVSQKELRNLDNVPHLMNNNLHLRSLNLNQAGFYEVLSHLGYIFHFNNCNN